MNYIFFFVGNVQKLANDCVHRPVHFLCSSLELYVFDAFFVIEKMTNRKNGAARRSRLVIVFNRRFLLPDCPKPTL